MYLNSEKLYFFLNSSRLTLTLDVFKYRIGNRRNRLKNRLTLTLDVFKYSKNQFLTPFKHRLTLTLDVFKFLE